LVCLIAAAAAKEEGRQSIIFSTYTKTAVLENRFAFSGLHTSVTADKQHLDTKHLTL
jgi:hypothetical protein